MVKFFILIILLIFSLNGCVILPLPAEKKTIEGISLSEERLSFLTPGVTTKEMLIAKLGEPYVVWLDACILAYHWTEQGGKLFIGIFGFGSGTGGVIDTKNRYVFLSQFDKNMLLIRSDLLKYPDVFSYGNLLQRWASQSPDICQGMEPW